MDVYFFQRIQRISISNVFEVLMKGQEGSVKKFSALFLLLPIIQMKVVNTNTALS